MKTAALIFALFLLVKPIIPLMEYAAFYDYIKNELCENKDIVEMKCNGKFYLAKELAKASDSQNSDDKNHSISTEHSLVFFQNTNTNYVFALPKEQKLKTKSLYNNIYKFHYINFIFHPPLV